MTKRVLFVCSVLCACGAPPDPRTVEGALAKAAEALARGASDDLFRVIDQRSRHALASIVEARHQAAEAIRRDYPAAQREAALAGLGDAAEAGDAAELFRRRCQSACLAELAAKVGAPVTVREQGEQTLVETSRGAQVVLHRGSDGWYGLMYELDGLVRERDRAAAELDLVRRNAGLYRAQGALEQETP